MKYDFDKIISREGSDSIKWDLIPDALPLWVADMDFPVLDEVVEAIKARASHPIYGYTNESKGWKKAYIDFWKRHYGFIFDEEDIFFSTGVVPTISSTVRKIAKSKVILMTPVYNIFFNSILNNGREPSISKLIYKDGSYSIDWKDLEERMMDEEANLLILCNPHNPIGKIWSKDELEKIGCLANKYGVTVLSDEIHGPISSPGKKYIPFASINETNRNISITAISVTKAFNLAGIQTSAVVIPNKELYKAVNRQLNTDECAEGNVFAYIAAEIALNKGDEWLKQLNEIIERNRNIASSFIKDEIGLDVIKQDATYLLWVDVSKYGQGEEIASYLLDKEKLFVSKGNVYGPGGENFIRINLACPLKILEEGLKRLKEGLLTYKN